MHVGRRQALAALAATLVASGSAAAVAATGPDYTTTILVTNLTHTKLWSSGEPEIAINPKNANNMVYVATKYKYVRVSVGGQKIDLPSSTLGPQNIEGQMFGEENCTAYYTMDRGLHWYPTPWPQGQRPLCGDPMVVADRNGTFYVAFDWM